MIALLARRESTMPAARRMTLSVGLSFSALACAGATGSAPLEGAAGGTRGDLREVSSGSVLQLPAEQAAANVEVKAPLERSWAALPTVYGDLGIPAQVLDSRNRTFGTRRLTQPRIGGRRTQDYVRCAFQGTGPSQVGGHRVQLSIVSRVGSSGSGSSLLATHIAGSASPVEGTSTEPVRCVSTGELEQRIATMLSERLQN